MSNSLAGCVSSYAAEAIAAERRASAVKADDAVVAENSQTAEQLVARALAAESAGNPQARLVLLRQALTVDPDYAPAHWHLGEVSIDDAWKTIDCVSTDSINEGKIAAYRKRRAQAGLDAEEQFALARWCHLNGLKDQERAHILFTLQLRPRHVGAGKRLTQLQQQSKQSVRIRQEIARQEALEATKALRDWRPRIVHLRNEAESQDTSRRHAALAELAAITDLSALPAVESVLGNADRDVVNAVVAWLAGFDDQRATDSMIRCSISASDSNVRRNAAGALKNRSMFSYIPSMMSILLPPTQIEYEQAYEIDGQTGFRLSFFQVGPDVDRRYRAGEARGLDVFAVGEVTPAMQQRTAAAFEMVDFVEASNAARLAQNEKIAQTLRVTTGQQLSDQPEAWWNWWLGYNEIYRVPEKRVENYITLADGRTVECFPAGTSVWTVTGPAPIERVQVGESVLSQNPWTGELAYKMVLSTTVRPPSPLITLRAGNETIHATRGHPFWVSGLGWQMAKELKVGQFLHTANGPVAIESVGAEGSAPAYNLLVDGFHTYFVTDRLFLVHDNMVREVLPATVPGMMTKSSVVAAKSAN